MRQTTPRVTVGRTPMTASLLIHDVQDGAVRTIEVVLSPQVIDLLIYDLAKQRLRINTLASPLRNRPRLPSKRG